MADAATMRSAVETLMTRMLAGGETELAEELVHPDFVNREADPERQNGASGAAATSEWLRSCFGNLRYDIHRIFIDGDMAAAYVTMHGTHEGGAALSFVADRTSSADWRHARVRRRAW